MSFQLDSVKFSMIKWVVIGKLEESGGKSEGFMYYVKSTDYEGGEFQTFIKQKRKTFQEYEAEYLRIVTEFYDNLPELVKICFDHEARNKKLAEESAEPNDAIEKNDHRLEANNEEEHKP